MFSIKCNNVAIIIINLEIPKTPANGYSCRLETILKTEAYIPSNLI